MDKILINRSRGGQQQDSNHDSSLESPLAIRLEGGLGNQIFHYLVATKLQTLQTRKIYLDASHYRLQSGKNARNLEIINFNISPILLRDRRRLCETIRYNYPLFFTRKLISAISGRILGKRLLHPTHRTLDLPHLLYKNINEMNENLGRYDYITREYMWDLREFISLRPLLKSQLTPNFTLNKANLAMLHRIQSSPKSCFLHIRRGDYVNLSEYDLLGLDYYFKAMQVMKDRLGEGVEFFIFGNDINFMQEHFSDFCIVNINDEASVSCDFVLMKACKNAILANSSLSGIIGFLCDGIVVYSKDAMPQTPHLPHFIGV